MNGIIGCAKHGDIAFFQIHLHKYAMNFFRVHVVVTNFSQDQFESRNGNVLFCVFLHQTMNVWHNKMKQICVDKSFIQPFVACAHVQSFF